MEGIVSDLIAVVRYSKPLLVTERHRLEALIRDAWGETDTESCALAVDAPGVVETDRPRCRELLRAVLAIHRDRGATRVTVTRSDGRLTVASDGDPLPEGTGSAFGHGAATGSRRPDPGTEAHPVSRRPSAYSTPPTPALASGRSCSTTSIPSSSRARSAMW